MGTKTPKIDPFFKEVAKKMRVDPERLRVKSIDPRGAITIQGPKPEIDLGFEIPEPWDYWEYCFSFTIDFTPHFLCNALQRDYETLKEALDAAVQAEDWDEVANLAEQLDDLQTRIERCREGYSRTHTYCIFPVDTR